MTRPRARLLAAALLCLAFPASAQQSLTPEDFLGLTRGKTLTYVDPATGELIGFEHFLPGGRTVWTRADGRCTHGTISVEGSEICYSYEDDDDGEGPHCWWPLREDGRLYVRLADAAREERQRITSITEEPLSCEAVPTA